MDRSLTIVVPTLGKRAAWLRDCLYSITLQGEENCRIIVVAPDSADLSVCDQFDVETSRYNGRGMSRAINHGWSLDPTSDYISWLGDDDLLAPGSLRATAAFLDGNPRCSMVYGRVRYIDADSSSLWMSHPTRFAAPYLRVGKNLVSQQGSLVRRSAASRIGYLDADLMNAMDQDFFTRLRAVGRRAYIPRELGAFRWHASSITSQKHSRNESELVRRRHLSSTQLRAYCAWRIVGRHFDWAVDAAVRRLPAPSVPRRDGLPYIEPQVVLGMKTR
jgi:GT2 family glycosyltransferase